MTFKLKDPGSAITHFIGMMMALLATIPLLVKAAREPDWLHLIALSVFALSMFLLYTASTTYHSLDISAKVNRRLQKMDHMMIFVLIAGSYTPICLIALKGHTGSQRIGNSDSSGFHERTVGKDLSDSDRRKGTVDPVCRPETVRAGGSRTL